MYLDRRALHSAGITEPLLCESYEFCRRLLVATEGKSWGWGTLALPPHKRPHFWALYGFWRYTDEILDGARDDSASVNDPTARRTEFDTWSAQVLVDLRAGHSHDPVCRALLHTMRAWDMDPELVTGYLGTVRMDLAVTEYPTRASLQSYVDGIAHAPARLLLPVLEPLTEEAARTMDALTDALILADFIRDVGVDLRLGRVYLPLEDLAMFGLNRSDLERGQVTSAVRELLRFESERARRLFADGIRVVGMLHSSSRPAIQGGAILRMAMLDEIERRDYDVFTVRPRLGATRTAGVLLRSGIPALATRLRTRPSPTARTMVGIASRPAPEPERT